MSVKHPKLWLLALTLFEDIARVIFLPTPRRLVYFILGLKCTPRGQSKVCKVNKTPGISTFTVVALRTMFRASYRGQQLFHFRSLRTAGMGMRNGGLGNGDSTYFTISTL